MAGGNTRPPARLAHRHQAWRREAKKRCSQGGVRRKCWSLFCFGYAAPPELRERAYGHVVTPPSPGARLDATRESDVRYRWAERIGIAVWSGGLYATKAPPMRTQRHARPSHRPSVVAAV